MAESQGSNIFKGCAVCFIPSRDLPQTIIASLCPTIEGEGATIIPLKPDGSINLEEVTHIISNTSDFPHYQEACDCMIPVVSTGWIQMSLIKSKTAPLRPYTPDPNLFFSGVTISCADIPTGDKDAIIGAVEALGGQESSALTKLVTHIVALTEDHPKCQQARERNLPTKIVLPHWFDDCLKLGKRIDDKPYLLPDPEILRKRSDEDIVVPSSAGIEGAVTARPDYFTQPTDAPRKLSVFKDKHVMLSDDLSLGSRLRVILENLIEGGGGSITATVHKASMFICHYRDGKDYIIASKNGLDVGNLSWLYHLIARNEWTSPLRKLLFYPIPRNGIPGFEEARVTLSNYGGDSRVYLENLVAASGGQFTKSMKPDNTHLITARDSSEKCQAAREWGINMVNHIWIEESYAKCKAQSLTNPRYTHFPPRTNLGEIIGRTQFDTATLEQLYFPEYPEDSPEHVRKPRPVMVNKDSNAATAPVPRESKTKIRKSTASTTTPSKTSLTAQTPTSNRLIGTGKENQTPLSTGSRGAKDRALSRLHELTPDIQLYEKEKSRKGPLWGGIRALDQIEKEKIESEKAKAKQKQAENSKKRSSSSPDQDSEEENDASDEDAHDVKRQKKTAHPIEMRLLITGYKVWIGDTNKEDKQRKKLRELGILVTQDPLNCHYIAAPHLIRTQKFLCALAAGIPVISTDFITACISSNEIPTPEKFLLKDPANEKRFGFKITESVKRAKAYKGKLLQGLVVYCTEELANGWTTYKAIVESNGGVCYVYRGRGGAQVKPGKMTEDEEIEPVYLLSGQKPEERRLWPKFEQMAEEGNMEPRIVVTEWLLDVTMRQKVEFGREYLAANASAKA